MTKDTDVVVKADRLREFCAAVYRALGLASDDAAIGADALVEAELRGKGIQGVGFLPYYASSIQDGGINARPHIRVVAETPAFALVDGDHGLGQVVSTRAMHMAIARAESEGSATVAVRNSNDFSMAGYYAMQALDRDMIGFCTTSSPSVITAAGGLDRILGQGPVAWAIPAGREHPIVVDMTHAVMPIGRIRAAARQGLPLPAGCAVNTEGEPVLDPAEALKEVTLVPIGGYKGFGLITIMQVLTGVLTGVLNGQALAPRSPARSGGHLFMALKVGAIMPVEEFKAGVDQLIREIRASRPAKGVDRVYVPGERALETKARLLEHGIPLSHATYDALQELGKTLKVAPIAV